MSLDLIAVTPNLSLAIKETEIKAKIIARLTELKLVDAKFKNSQDVLLLICNLTEHLIRDKKIKKKELVLDILQTVFTLTAIERSVIDNNIEFLHSNGAIKRLSRFYLFCCSAYELFFKSKAKKV